MENFIGFIIGLGLGIFIAINACTSYFHTQAVKNGAGHYLMDTNYGSTSWHWNNETTPKANE